MHSPLPSFLPVLAGFCPLTTGHLSAKHFETKTKRVKSKKTKKKSLWKALKLQTSWSKEKREKNTKPKKQKTPNLATVRQFFHQPASSTYTTSTWTILWLWRGARPEARTQEIGHKMGPKVTLSTETNGSWCLLAILPWTTGNVSLKKRPCI